MHHYSRGKTGALDGRLTAVAGAHATVTIPADTGGGAFERLAVGSLLQIEGLRATAIAAVTAIAERPGESGSIVVAEVDLLGEILNEPDGAKRFQRGVSDYPGIRSRVDFLDADHLRLVHEAAGDSSIEVGTLALDHSIGAHLRVDDLLNKHFAVLGTTGVGKSSAVALLLREILVARPRQRMLLLDPHNEYASSFGEKAKVLNPTNLKLPFWLFTFEEVVDAFFRGRPGVEEEMEILAQVIPEAKNLYAETREQGVGTVRKADVEGLGYALDTPVPYRLADLVQLIDRRMGKLENRSQVPIYQRLLTRIESLGNDPRYRFMFHGANVGGDTMGQLVSGLFNLTDRKTSVTIVQLAGFPGEVVDSLVSVLCRMAFEFGLWSGGAVPVLIVCEEAHRYAPEDRTAGFAPTRRAVARIAKEGRKFGISLGLVTQRPADLDASIVSQCGTLLAMRMANDRDQAIIRAAVPDAAAGLVSSVSALGAREAFAFGEGVALPTRIRFKTLPDPFLPRTVTMGVVGNTDEVLDQWQVSTAVERWRSAGVARRFRSAFSME